MVVVHMRGNRTWRKGKQMIECNGKTVLYVGRRYKYRQKNTIRTFPDLLPAGQSGGCDEGAEVAEILLQGVDGDPESLASRLFGGWARSGVS